MITCHSSRIQLDFREIAQSESITVNIRTLLSFPMHFIASSKQATVNQAHDNSSKRTSITSNYDTLSKTSAQM